MELLKKNQPFVRWCMVALSLLMVAAAPNDNFVTLQSALQGRDSSRFTGSDNIRFTVPYRTVGKILKQKPLASGNQAYEIEIVRSSNTSQVGEKVWIYHDRTGHSERLSFCEDVECSNPRFEQQLAAPGKPKRRPQVAVRTETQAEPVIASAAVTSEGTIKMPPRKPPVAPPHAVQPVVAVATPAAKGKSAAGTAKAIIDAQNFICEPTPVAAVPPKFQETSVQGRKKALQQLFNSSPAEGARRVLATMYQSCDVLDKEYDGSMRLAAGSLRAFEDQSGYNQIGFTKDSAIKAVASHFYMHNAKREPGCRDMSQTPVKYYYGGQADKKALKEGVLDVMQNRAEGADLASSIGLDSSGQAGASFIASGRRLLPYQDVNALTTDGFLAEANGNRCFKRPDLTGPDSVRPGDVIAFKGHVVMVNKVKDPADPFGWKKQYPAKGALTEEICRTGTYKPTPENLQFNVFQSVGNSRVQVADSGSAIGPAITSMAYAISNNASRQFYMTELARQACLAMVTNKPLKVQTTQNWALIRHVGEEKPECMSPIDVKVRDSQCIESCLLERYSEPGV